MLNRNRENILFGVEVLLLVWFSITTAYTDVALAFFALSLLRFLWKMGDGSFFLELVFLMANITCMLMPTLGYLIFTRNNGLARLFIKYMPVPEEQYFGFIIPALVALSWSFFLFRKKSRDTGSVINPIVARLKIRVQQIPPSKLMILGGISVVARLIHDLLPEGLQQVDFFLYL